MKNEETGYKSSLEKESIRGSEGNIPREHEQSMRGSEGSLEGNADAVKENMKEKVAKGVAAVAGALEGFTNEARKNDLPQKTQQAIEKAGETAQKAAEATKAQVDRMKGGSGGSSGSGGSGSSGSSMGSSSGSTSSMDQKRYPGNQL